MTSLNQVYKCNICGNIVELVQAGKGHLVCCGQPMELLAEKTEDVAHEKHVPVVSQAENGIKVNVGSIPHPMEESHYIEWVELVADGRICRKRLNPGDAPEASFGSKAKDFIIRSYCNIHGLWKSK